MKESETDLTQDLTAHLSQPDHELNVVGLANVNRKFTINDPSNGPTILFRVASAYINFTHGWSKTGDVSDQDFEAAVDTTLPRDAVLYPILPMAVDFEEEVWPYLSNLFSSGTGSRNPVKMQEFVRYQAMTLTAYQQALVPVMLNHLTYHFDWTKVFPYTQSVPKFLYDLCVQYDCTDVGIANRWIPLLKRFDSLIAFPRMIAEIKRLYTPMKSVDLRGRILVPINSSNLMVDHASDTFDRVTKLLDYVHNDLYIPGAAISSFLPFPLANFDLWSFPVEAPIDVSRANGWYNSGLKNVDPFGDTGDPSSKDQMVATLSSTGGTVDRVMFLTQNAQPTWGELRWSNVFEVKLDLLDNTYYLGSMHKLGGVVVVGELDSYAFYDGEVITSDQMKRYENYVNCRFIEDDLTLGRLSPGFIASTFDRDSYVRLIRQESTYAWNTEVLKSVAINLAGASLREVRWTISQGVAAGVSSPN